MRINLRNYSEILQKLEEIKDLKVNKEKTFKYEDFYIQLEENNKTLFFIDYNVYRDEYSCKTDFHNPYLRFKDKDIKVLERLDKEGKTPEFIKKYKTSMELVLDLKIILKNSDSKD